jgi:hypothetical protein
VSNLENLGILKKVSIADGAADIHDLESMSVDQMDLSNTGTQCMRMIVLEYQRLFTQPIDEAGQGGKKLIMFAVTVPGGDPAEAVLGAGCLYDIDETGYDEDTQTLSLSAKLLAVSDIPGVRDAIIAGADGYTAATQDDSQTIVVAIK